MDGLVSKVRERVEKKERIKLKRESRKRKKKE